MKINLAQSAGFCFGVKRALSIALKTASTHKNVFMLGDIVHNEEVVNQIKEAGIKKINRLSKTKDTVLLIRAHGSAKETYSQAKRLGYRLIDATCPMVQEIHRIAQDAEHKGFSVIVIGDKRHDEVKGIVGQLQRRAIVMSPEEKIFPSRIKRTKKTAIVVQSTQNFEKIASLVETLSHYIPNVKFYNTICKPTTTKQAEMKLLPRHNDVVLIIGSKQSANTKRLFELSKSLNKNSYWIQSKKDIKPGWFKDATTVGVTAGASTPDTTTKEVIEYLQHL